MNKEIKDIYEKTVMDFSIEEEFFEDWRPPENWVKIFYKTYPRLPNTPLKNREEEGELIDMLKKRSSRRDFLDSPLPRESMDTLIYHSMGIKDLYKERSPETRRFYPSGGARYPVESYLIANNLDDLSRGAYHYNIKNNFWENLIEKDLRDESINIFGKDISQGNPNFFVLTSAINRSEVKYGIHAYRFSLLEAGHIAQNIALISEKLGIGTCPIGGFDNKRLVSLFDLPGDEIPLYAIAIGKSESLDV